MYYYISENGNDEPNFEDIYSGKGLNKCLRIEYKIELAKNKYSFSELLILFNDKVKKISLIDLFCDEVYNYTDLRFLANIIKDMRDMNGMYVWFKNL